MRCRRSDRAKPCVTSKSPPCGRKKDKRIYGTKIKLCQRWNDTTTWPQPSVSWYLYVPAIVTEIILRSIHRMYLCVSFWCQETKPTMMSLYIINWLVVTPRGLTVHCHMWNETLNVSQVNFRLHNFNAAKTLANNIHDLNNTWSPHLPSDPPLWSPFPSLPKPRFI